MKVYKISENQMKIDCENSTINPTINNQILNFNTLTDNFFVKQFDKTTSTSFK